MHKLKVVDFFCGAGGFSEGFRQMGYQIIYGYDFWRPAVETYNYNFDLACVPKNILDFKNSIKEIDQIPNTEIILGSPPCVSFSSSNKSGKSDKSLGVELTEAFLRIVAVKKHQNGSVLKAWFMENVPNSKRYLQPEYTFKDLGLGEWASQNRISPLKIAISLYENSSIINSADYGSFQQRKRIIAGEIVKKGKLIIPEKTHSESKFIGKKLYRNIGEIKRLIPNPFSTSSRFFPDPQYGFYINTSELTDHFYDSGVYEIEWKFSKFWKTNHPYMGKMSFPENENKPSRTITATRITNSRESILYKSEVSRVGDGEYRLPTVREAAIIMGFPITYQFKGAERTKWRLVGNAVCCSVSRAFAELVLDHLQIEKPKEVFIEKNKNLESIFNLNTHKLKNFDNPPFKKTGSRFRRHPFKDGNITVTLSNYDITQNGKFQGKWYTSIQYGNGKGFPIQNIEDNFFKNLEGLISKYSHGKEFLALINNGFSEKISKAEELQMLYEQQKSTRIYKEPTELVDKVKEIVDLLNLGNIEFIQSENKVFKYKQNVPLKQLFVLYAINKISTIANGN